MEPSLGLRVVRGPDWRWEEQDGGEGCVGTVAELGREKKAVAVQWDCGTRAWYHSGAEDKFDLRVLDTAPTGLKFPEVVCSGCYAEGVAGTYWKCAHCYEYHLCHSCYLLGRHCQEHPFFRMQSTKQTPRVKYMSPRVDARQVEAKGIFPGAEVVRGKNWKFGDQDGGAGSVGRVTAAEGWKDLSARSVAKVEWSATGKSNIYRVGHRGKVDLKCVTVGSGGHYYPEHLCTLGSGALVDFFDEDEIVAGDMITVSLDPDIFKIVQETIHEWSVEMLQLLGHSAVVLSVLEHQRLFIFSHSTKFILGYSAATKLKHCRQGETVRITSDISVLHRLQSQGEIWHDDLVTTLGQIGRVTKVSVLNKVKVTVQGRGWLYYPLCLLPAPGENAPETIDPQNENLGIMQGIASIKIFRNEVMRAGITDVALLDGDLETLSSFIYSNETKQTMKENLLAYYAVTGMIPALKMVLESGVDPNIMFGGTSLISACIKWSYNFYSNQEEACLALMGAGVDICHKPGISRQSPHNIIVAMIVGSYQLQKAIATHSGVILNAQADDGGTALSYAAIVSNHLGVAILLGAGASPTIYHVNPLLEAGRSGVVSVVEMLVVHAKEHLNVQDPNTEDAAIFSAALHGNSKVCNILAAQECIDINVKGSQMETPLHAAADRNCWGALECLVGWGAELNVADIGGRTPLNVVVRHKSSVVPDSMQLKMVHEELSEASRASGGGAVEGYVAVACFLVQEGADFHIKDKEGLSPFQILPPEMASLMTTYVKNHPGSFHGSLRSTRQRLMHELPKQLKLSRSADSTASAALLSGPSGSKPLVNLHNQVKAETTFVHVKTQHKGTQDVAAMKQQRPASFSDGGSQLSQTSEDLTVESSEHFNSAAMKQQPPTSSSDGGSQQSQASAVESSENFSPNSQGQLCLLCEEHPSSVKFSPCGHTVMCSVCSERAKKCYFCKAPVTAKTQLQ